MNLPMQTSPVTATLAAPPQPRSLVAVPAWVELPRLAPAAVPVAAAAPGLPGPELPAVPPKHPALPSPVPGLAQLLRIADAAPAGQRWVPGSEQALLRNAHYSNTRAQLAYALAGPYNSVEGDVRMRDGIPVMQHDGSGSHDLTFEQWAILAARAGKHLRIDVKESAALEPIARILERIGVPSGSITFNVAAGAPWSGANQKVPTIRALRERFPASWITLNLPLPLGPGYLLAVRIARELGPERLGVAIMGGLVHERDIRLLRTAFAAVNAWNEPRLKELDIEAETRRLRAMGVNGMIDLRRREDPLASD
jgi:hypothetical protein